MKKRLLASLLLIIMCVSFLASCGDKSTVTFDENGNYVPTNEMEITVWQTQGTDYTAKALKGSIVTKWLEDKTKVTVKNIYGNDGSQWDAKLTKLVAGNNLPEILACGAYQGPAHFSKLNELEQVWELTPEMLQKYAPNVWERVPQKYWDAIKVDGKILGIPFSNPASKETIPQASDEELNAIQELSVVPKNDVTIDFNVSLFVRDDILKMFYPEAKTYEEIEKILYEKNEPIGEELLDIPIYTTEEYIDFMYKIKDAKIKEGGKNVYAYGYAGSDNWSALAHLGADMYGYKGHYYTGSWNDVTKEINVPLVDDVVKKAAKTQNKMLADKVIDPESMTHNMSQAKEKILNGLYAIAPIASITDLKTINDSLKAQGKKYRYRPFYTQVPALKQYSAFEEEKLWGESLCILKTVDEEGLYQILNWINVQFSDEWESVIFWGPEEAGLYTVDENGKRQYKDERFMEYFVNGNREALKPEETLGIGGPTSAGYQIGGLFSVKASTNRWDPKVHLNEIVYGPAVNSGFKFKKDSEHVTSVKTYPPCQGWASIYADIPEVVTFWAERGQWENNFQIAMASSPKEFDKKWDEAVEELYKIVDIDAMEKKMTEIAKPIADVLTEK